LAGGLRMSRQEGMMIRKQVVEMAVAVTVMGAGMAACATRGDEPSTDGEDSAPTSAPSTSAPSTSAKPAAATKITIKSTQPLDMVVYREVDDPVWHPATQLTSGKFTAKVRGPYLVTTVCQAAQPGTPVLFAQVWRAGRTLDDAHELDVPFTCAFDAPKPLPEVTGTLSQSDVGDIATVALGNGQFATAVSDPDPAFPFSLLVPKGTYSLYAFDQRRIAIRHALAVKRSVAIPAIDLDTEGSPYDVTPFSQTADPSVFQHAVTRVETADAEAAGNDLPFQLTDVGLAIVAAPNALLSADDNQTVSMQADTFTTVGNVFRIDNVASRKPWRAGDALTFVEPDQIGNAAWSFDSAGQQVLTWTTLPAFTIISNETRGFTVSGNFADDFTELSPAFVAATGATSMLVDTSIPGFQADWMVDYSMTIGVDYTRIMFAQDVTDPTMPEHAPIFTSDISEDVAPGIAPNRRAAVAGRPAQPPMPQTRTLVRAR
jgi:hypothetical protein